MSESISDNLDLILSMSSVQPFSSISSLDFTSLIFPMTDSISLTLDLICSKCFCADWNLSIRTKIGSISFENFSSLGFISNVLLGRSAIDSCVGSFSEGIGGIIGPPSGSSVT